MQILVLSSLAYSLVNFRGPLLQAMVAAGHKVTAVAPDRDPAVEQQLLGHGVGFRHIPMHRTAARPGSDLRLLSSYVQLIWELQPDIVLAYTQKPIIYGGLATRIAGLMGRGTLGRTSWQPRFFALMSGLGYAFTPGSPIAPWMRLLVKQLYRAAVARAGAIFVFNTADRSDMLSLGIIKPDQRVVQVPGSGVDLARFTPAQVPSAPHFLMVGRLMRDKGVIEFCEAAGEVVRSHPEARFSILGRIEEQNPTGLSEAECGELAKRYPVRFLEPTDDVRPYLAACSVFVLPSYYREGLPRTILEALATGRAVITTDMPGCRDPIHEGVNGFIVPPRDAAAVAKAMFRFLDEPGLAERMGPLGRAAAEDVYDVRKVNAQLFEVMGLTDKPGSEYLGGAANSAPEPVHRARAAAGAVR